MSYDLEEYWQKIKNGDKQAFKILFNEYYSLLCYYSLQITNDYSLSEEIVQDVFLKLWQDRETITIRSSFKSYLFRAVHNLSINENKKKNTAKYVVHRTVPAEIWSIIMDHMDSEDFIIDKITSVDTEKIINVAIDSLPFQCRLVFRLSRFENKSNKEISGLLNISVNTVRAHIFHALEIISKVLHKEY